MRGSLFSLQVSSFRGVIVCEAGKRAGKVRAGSHAFRAVFFSFPFLFSSWCSSTVIDIAARSARVSLLRFFFVVVCASGAEDGGAGAALDLVQSTGGAALSPLNPFALFPVQGSFGVWR